MIALFAALDVAFAHTLAHVPGGGQGASFPLWFMAAPGISAVFFFTISGFLIAAYRAYGKRYRTETAYFDTEGTCFNKPIQSYGTWRADAAAACHDLIAWDALTRASAAESPVDPSGLSCAAVDHLRSFSPLPFRLTSVSKYSPARHSAEILLRKIGNPHVPPAHFMLDVESLAAA